MLSLIVGLFAVIGAVTVLGLFLLAGLAAGDALEAWQHRDREPERCPDCGHVHGPAHHEAHGDWPPSERIL